MDSHSKSKLDKILVILTFSIIILVLDQLSKLYFLHILDLSNKLIMVAIPGFFYLKMAWNEGINFGLFASGSYNTKIILIAFPTIICLAVLFWAIRQTDYLIHLFAASIIGGAFGNVLDRIVYGAVVDFLNITCCGIQNPYSFNVADVSIFLGAVGIIFYSNTSNNKSDIVS